MDKAKALMEGVTLDIVAYLVDEYGFSIEMALDKLYNSEVFVKLLDSETGLYRESSAYVADLVRDELVCGRMIQNEI